MFIPWPRLTNRLNDQHGSTLLLCIFVLLILTVLGLASTQTSSLEINLAANERDYQKALYAAESGIEHMRAVLQNDLIAGNQSNLANGNAVDWDFALNPIQQITNTTADGYTYEVTVANNTDQTGETTTNDTDRLIYVTSEATGPRNSTATIQVLLYADATSKTLTDYAAQAGGGAGKTNTSNDVSAIDVGSAEQTTLDKL